ncbi:MFS transporter [Leucobacter luti]|uniref:Putative MFS family arabinose efflux permease n=1 Tax=Leucobacter luti TaxID=340320 RepID=A0A4Q7TXD9_9MICO|nr:MFS transporter [Leucobacter luti]MBL3698527.1 MFS transporter [Leucobacter luti]RZT65901.1 putative MFS family arabinose efflux permease [Leucobacter luti]
MHHTPAGSGRAGAPVMTALITTWVFALLPANLVPSIVEKLVYQLDVSVTTAGAVATGMTLANAAAVLLSRRAVQRGNRVVIARTGLAIMIVAFASGVAWPTATVSLIALVAGGVGSGLVISAATAAVSATPNPDRATTIVMTVNRFVVAIAFLMIPLVGGGLRELFLILAIPGILGFIGAHWLPRVPEETAAVSVVGTAAAAVSAGDAAPPAPAASRAAAAARAVASPAQQRTRRIGWLLALGFGAWSITDDGVYGLVGVIVGESDMPVADSFVPMIFSLSVFCGLGGALLAPFFHRWFGRTASLAVLLAVSALAKLGLIVLVSPVMYATASAVWGFVFGAMLPLVFGLAASLSRDGGVSVLVNGVYIIGVALGPLVATQLFDRFGTGALAAVMTTLAALTAGVIVYASRFAERTGRPRDPQPPAPTTAAAAAAPIGAQA